MSTPTVPTYYYSAMDIKQANDIQRQLRRSISEKAPNHVCAVSIADVLAILSVFEYQSADRFIANHRDECHVRCPVKLVVTRSREDWPDVVRAYHVAPVCACHDDVLLTSGSMYSNSYDVRLLQRTVLAHITNTFVPELYDSIDVEMMRPFDSATSWNMCTACEEMCFTVGNCIQCSARVCALCSFVHGDACVSCVKKLC